MNSPAVFCKTDKGHQEVKTRSDLIDYVPGCTRRHRMMDAIFQSKDAFFARSMAVELDRWLDR